MGFLLNFWHVRTFFVLRWQASPPPRAIRSVPAREAFAKPSIAAAPSIAAVEAKRVIGHSAKFADARWRLAMASVIQRISILVQGIRVLGHHAVALGTVDGFPRHISPIQWFTCRRGIGHAIRSQHSAGTHRIGGRAKRRRPVLVWAESTITDPGHVIAVTAAAQEIRGDVHDEVNPLSRIHGLLQTERIWISLIFTTRYIRTDNYIRKRTGI
mmetsp:Transcript_607/g.755  ORF Transcript_607/g.755 Transcript_607/m.755 type:complete len:213 (-) Transcript_607:602-1240(-)